MKTLVLTVLLWAVFVCRIIGGEPTAYGVFEILSPAQPENLSALEVAEIMGADSKKDILANGYLASKHVTCLFDEVGYRYTGGDNYKNDLVKFRLRIPPGFRKNPHGDTKYPLVVWFHGMGENGDDNKRQLAHMHHALNVLTGENAKDFFILAPQCSVEDQYWSTPSTKQTDIEDSPVWIAGEVVENLLEEFPIDRDRVSLVGFCSGIFGVHRMLQDHPDMFSAAVFISRGLPDNQYGNIITNVHIKFFYGINDNSVKKEEIHKYVEAVNEQGGQASVVICENEAGDRHNSWRAAFVKYKAFEWMISQRRNQKEIKNEE